ncbi:MAG: carboxy terminal-processing peptidase [Pseudomonadota bacterium]
MKKKLLYPIVFTLFVCFRISLSGCATAPALEPSDFYSPLAPAAENAETCREIIEQLQHDHYEHLAIDDQMSGRMLDRYISDLDPGRSYFMEKDIQEFEPYRFQLDDALTSGDLAPAFKIFNRYRQRMTERLTFMINHLETGMQDIAFDADESMETERKNSPWPATDGAWDDIWRKRLKSGLLNLKLADKTLEEARQILLKRFRSQLNQARQLTSEDVFQTFINALTRTFDPHTEYLSPRVSENFNITMSLSLEGIGAVLQNENEYTKVVSLVPGGPADKAKQLKPGDRIISVGQGADSEVVSVVGWRLDDVVQLIRGPKETVVRLEIIPANVDDEHQTKVIAIARDRVKLEEQAAQKKIINLPLKGRARKIGIIDIPGFYLDFKGLQSHDPAYKSTTHDVLRLLKELEAEHVEGIIIDLRDNGGGSLQEANLLTGMFIKQGPIVQVRNAKAGITVLADSDPDIAYSGPLAILINRMSASASEIVAAAIQDYRRGIIIGEQTFGKGTVQALVTLKRGQLKITQAKFYRISGESTQRKGVTPDVYYPSLYDMDKMGESALPQALPWDTITPAAYMSDTRLMQKIPRINEFHERRIKENPDYAYLMETMEHLKKAREKTDVSLREATRRQEDGEAKQWRLNIENKRRLAKNLKPLEKLSDLDPDNKTEESAGRKAEDDPELIEAGNVLLDYISLLKH